MKERNHGPGAVISKRFKQNSFILSANHSWVNIEFVVVVKNLSSFILLFEKKLCNSGTTGGFKCGAMYIVNYWSQKILIAIFVVP